MRERIHPLVRLSGQQAVHQRGDQIAALPVGMTAGEAIERLRVLHDELEDLSYVYVVDEQGRLEGVLSFGVWLALAKAQPIAGFDDDAQDMLGELGAESLQ